jgi:ferritin
MLRLWLVSEREEQTSMSMSKTVQDALNQQINNELSASYEYLAMSAWCEGQALQGAAKWLRLQSQEEYGHAMKLYDFVLARGGQVDLKALSAPTQTYKSLHDVFDKVLSQEQQVTQQIDTLYDLAFREKAYAATVELQWFLTEQVEEEKSSREIVSKLKLIGHDVPSVLDLDRELGARSTV